MKQYFFFFFFHDKDFKRFIIGEKPNNNKNCEFLNSFK